MTGHCKHYSYDIGSRPMDPDGGPRCAKGCEIGGRTYRELGACMPPSTTPGAFPPFAVCPMREDWTEADVAARTKFMFERTASALALIAAIGAITPKGKAGWGRSCLIACTQCKDGNVSWNRDSMNGHLWAECSTPDCLQIHSAM